jgi:peptidyl-prolyl cis-trans isomerase SurA
MKLISGKWVVISLLLILPGLSLFSQKLVESVAGIAGNEVIYLSDIENGVVQELINGNKMSPDVLRCKIFEDMLVQKLFLDQAKIDSIEVSDDNIEGNLNMTLNRYIAQVGSEKALEDYFKKSIIEIKKDIKQAMLNQEIISEVQTSLAKNISITPSDVKRFYQSIPKDSLPKIPAQVEISIIQFDPPDNEQNKADARQKLLDLRSRILAGESFSALAILYSEDTETAKRGGELGFTARNSLEKPFADAAFSLSKNSVSKIVETRYGYHIIQLIDRLGDMANVRHILIRPKVRPDQAIIAMRKLDSLANLIRKDSLKFESAAIRYSTHKDSRINGGKFVKNDPADRVTWFTLDQLDKETYVKVRELKIGEISDAFKATDENGNAVFRIVRLDNQTPAHVADFETDYQSLYNETLMQRRAKYFQQWINKKIGITYIRISEEFKTCPFDNKGWLK